MGKSQIYVPQVTRDYHKSEITRFVDVFNDKLFPVFEDTDKQGDQYAEDYYHKFMEMPGDDSIDPATIAEDALEKGIDYYSSLTLAKYEFTAMSIATLYFMWEQQVRRFLYEEMSHLFKLEFKTFCTNIGQIKDRFSFHNLNIEELECWPEINKLRLLCNVIKHGDGKSAKELYQIDNSFFEIDLTALADTDDHKLETTLLDENLVIDQNTFNRFAKVLEHFWDQIPERNYSGELTNTN